MTSAVWWCCGGQSVPVGQGDGKQLPPVLHGPLETESVQHGDSCLQAVAVGSRGATVDHVAGSSSENNAACRVVGPKLSADHVSDCRKAADQASASLSTVVAAASRMTADVGRSVTSRRA